MASLIADNDLDIKRVITKCFRRVLEIEEYGNSYTDFYGLFYESQHKNFSPALHSPWKIKRM